MEDNSFNEESLSQMKIGGSSQAEQILKGLEELEQLLEKEQRLHDTFASRRLLGECMSRGCRMQRANARPTLGWGHR